MPEKKKPKKTFSITIIPDDGSESKGYVGVSKNKLIALVAAISVVVFISGVLFTFFTPVKLLIPDYREKLRVERSLLKNQMVLDSLNRQMESLDLYNTRLKSALGISPMNIDTAALSPQQRATSTPRNHYNFAVENLMTHVVQNYRQTSKPKVLEAFVSGTLSQGFSPQTSHYGIDIATASNESVGVIADGAILFADWTYEYGYSVIVDHSHFISFYKHCNTVFVREGMRVKKGEVIALTGSRGHESSGPHLHLEVWKDGVPVNPSQYINLN
jgi:murein DD-endopeptidase MepM/ murein hydrolase activator NlpD